MLLWSGETLTGESAWVVTILLYGNDVFNVCLLRYLHGARDYGCPLTLCLVHGRSSVAVPYQVEGAGVEAGEGMLVILVLPEGGVGRQRLMEATWSIKL